MKLLKLVPDDTNIKFLKLRIPFFVLSIVLIAGSWAAVLVNGLNFGGRLRRRAGSASDLRGSARPRRFPQLRELVGGLGYGEPVVQEFGAPNQVSIRVPLPEGTEETPGAATEIGETVIAWRSGRLPPSGARTDGNDTVSGKVAGEFRNQARGWPCWRRCWRWRSISGCGSNGSSVSARCLRCSTMSSVTLGLFALTQLEFGLQIVAAILAIIGYSLNDTIVVYDRIRENLKKFRKMPLAELLDLSVNEDAGAHRHDLAHAVRGAAAAAVLRPAEPVRHGRGDHRGPVRRHLFRRSIWLGRC